MHPDLPPHLAGRTAVGLRPGEPVAQFEVGWQNFVYFLVDWQRRRAALIDATSAEPVAALAGQGIELEAVLLTHAHADHTAGLAELLEAQPSLVAYVHPLDRSRLDARLRDSARVRPLVDGERLAVGSLAVEVLHTPGHSAGACCFLLHGSPPYLCSGDTLFVRDCGRTDLPSGDVAAMFASLARLKRLPAETVILPGHHYAQACASTLGRELAESPPLRARDVEELERLP